jgi:hypothetical protein
VADCIRQGLPGHGAVFRGLNRLKAWNGVHRRPMPYGCTGSRVATAGQPS